MLRHSLLSRLLALLLSCISPEYRSRQPRTHTIVCPSLCIYLRRRGCVRSFSGHKNRTRPSGIGFSPCLRYIAAASEDCSCYLYDVRTGTYADKLAHRDAVADVAFNPLHPQLATAGYDGKVRFFAAS